MTEIITRREAMLAGRTPEEVDALVRSGRWVAVRRGVYLPEASLPDDLRAREALRVRAAVGATKLDAVGSHESAALVHGLPLFAPYQGPVLVTRTRAPRGARPAPRHCAPLVAQVPASDQTLVLGAPVTTLARTAVDLARTRPALSAVVVLDAALRAGCSRAELLEVVDRQRGWPGSAQARERVLFADGRSESALESIGRWQMRGLGLPAPDLQVTLGGLHSPIGRVDFYFRAEHTVVEADGAVKYRPREDGKPVTGTLFEEKRREDALRDAGFEVVRFTWDEVVDHPEVVLERVLRAFRRAADRRR